VDGHPGTAAREALVEAMVDVFTAPVRVVRIYFDGNLPHREQRSTQVEVVYPGGDGDQRADRAILHDLAERDSAGGRPPVTVVTRDIKLARRARKRGATVVDPEAFFLAWIEEGLGSGSPVTPE